jgi:hypothetical protein
MNRVLHFEILGNSLSSNGRILMNSGQTLYDVANRFPAFHILEGSWLRAYNLVEQHMQIPYLHSVVRKDRFSVSDIQWELYVPAIRLG